MTTIALGIPHTPWVPARVESMARLRGELEIHEHDDTNDESGYPACSGTEALEKGMCGPPLGPAHYREFTDRAPNNVWAEALWTWLHETGADWCLQLQDDVMVAPCFWPAIRAMLSALPPDADIVGLTSTHPMAPDVAKRGHRWYRTEANLVGWAYCIRREALGEFLEGRAQLPPKFREQNEDEQIAEWARVSGRGVWHPVPAIIDHDTSIPSSYKNDAHSHRRPQVTWRTYDERELTDPTWWIPSGTPELLAMPPQFECWACGKEAAPLRFPNGLRLGKQCIANIMSNLVNRL